jgi:hypothetical protein
MENRFVVFPDLDERLSVRPKRARACANSVSASSGGVNDALTWR